jgi:hypothetical protein
VTRELVRQTKRGAGVSGGREQRLNRTTKAPILRRLQGIGVSSPDKPEDTGGWAGTRSSAGSMGVLLGGAMPVGGVLRDACASPVCALPAPTRAAPDVSRRWAGPKGAKRWAYTAHPARAHTHTHTHTPPTGGTPHQPNPPPADQPTQPTKCWLESSSLRSLFSPGPVGEPVGGVRGGAPWSERRELGEERSRSHVGREEIAL